MQSTSWYSPNWDGHLPEGVLCDVPLESVSLACVARGIPVPASVCPVSKLDSTLIDSKVIRDVISAKVADVLEEPSSLDAAIAQFMKSIRPAIDQFNQVNSPLCFHYYLETELQVPRLT